MPTVVLVTGLPGTGKSSLADGVGRARGVPVFGWDWLMGALTRFRLADGLEVETYREVGYSLMTSLVERQLRNHAGAILDCVAREEPRRRWAALAAAHGAGFLVVECTCREAALHRSRVEGRRRDIPGWHELEWDHVRQARASYTPLEYPDLILDASEALDANLDQLLRMYDDDMRR